MTAGIKSLRSNIVKRYIGGNSLFQFLQAALAEIHLRIISPMKSYQKNHENQYLYRKQLQDAK
ncbi:MAG: hypothetical protein LBC02_06385 [Planctomycetaceae bacterium]|jgi:hypothetical protein|nr:hypothetical protein [Planctomycetaceae bacterium]